MHPVLFYTKRNGTSLKILLFVALIRYNAFYRTGGCLAHRLKRSATFGRPEMTARSTRGYCPLFVLLIMLALCMSVSCSRGGSPTQPELGSDGSLAGTNPPNERNARTPDGYEGRSCWGFYTMELDFENGVINVIENRELALHLNVKNILLSDWWCPTNNCVQIQFLEMDPDNEHYIIKGTLMNPTFFTGFDVRVIIFLDDKGHQLLNPDDFTMLYEDEDDINPFRAFEKDTADRSFGSYSTSSEIFDMHIPNVPGKFLIDFAIDASWPTNCEEPFDLENFGYEGSIYPDDPDLDGIDQGEGIVYVEVSDWQLNVSEVTIDTTPITGDITSLVYNPDLDRWETLIANGEDADPGAYVCLIAAFSDVDPSIGLYNYLTIVVDETPPPAVQTIWGHIGDAVYLDGFDGAVVSVVPQDPLGYYPPPFPTVNGEYSVDVTTGVYNVSVTMDDGVHLPQNAWDVIVTENEDVHLNFGLHWPGQLDQYDPLDLEIGWAEVMGCAGRVVDPLGMPISGAMIELRDPAAGLDQQFVMAEITDEGGYFSFTNLVIMYEVLGIPTLILQFHMIVKATGFFENDIGTFPTVKDGVPYSVIELQPHGQIPIWEESFEEESGWSYGGYYHRQLYSPAILNMSFNPAFNLVVMPPDEVYDGAIPPPTDGDYYLWYGVEADGNILEPWSGNAGGAYSGGMSIDPHSGTATSPQIDLSGYSTARVEFDMTYSMESQNVPDFDLIYFFVNGSQVGFYNPCVNPYTEAYTYTQRGHNRTIIWCRYVHDISLFTGSTATLSFSFNTVDSLYNGYRGQFIDNIQVFAE